MTQRYCDDVDPPYDRLDETEWDDGPDAPDAWVPIPPDHVLTRHDNPTGEPVACWFMGEISCFVEGLGI